MDFVADIASMRFAHLPPAEAQRGREAAEYFAALLQQLLPESLPLISS